MKNTISLYKKDCLKLLATIPSNSIDLVLIDPPYDVSQRNVKNHGRNRDFGYWDHGTTNMKKVVEESYRVLKKGGTMICFYDVWKVTKLKSLMESARFKQLRMIEWIKTNPFPINCNNNYLLGIREIALTGVKGGKPTFNSKYDNGIYTYPIYQGKDRFHTTQKPVALIQELIEKHSEAGDTVLDCFSGSGTTAVACINSGRNFVGSEKDNDYFLKSVKRLENEMIQKMDDFDEDTTKMKFEGTGLHKAA